MKDSKFIELLNLYVDNQISSGDAARLELEIQQNPRRRQVYRQYCKMQKACGLLAENFRTDLPTETDGAKIIKLKPERRSFVRQVYVVGSLAAACVAAGVVIIRGGAPGATLPKSVAVATDHAILGNEASTKPGPPEPVLPPLQLAFGGLDRRDNATNPLERAQFQWMNAVQPRALSMQDVRFEVPTAPLQTDDLTFRNRVPLNQQSDYPVALEFRR